MKPVIPSNIKFGRGRSALQQRLLGLTERRSGSHREDGASGGTVLVKRIGSTAWRVQVSDDGAIIALGVRADTGREYEVLLGTVDSTPIVTDLLNEMVRTHRGKPPKAFAGDAGPNHARSVPVQPLSTRIEQSGDKPVLILDFGGTVLKVAIDPVKLQQALSALQA
jgi:hypothetical protein